MRGLRWIFIALYVTLLAGLIAVDSLSFGFPVVSAVTVGSLALFIFGAGTVHLCRPVRRPRLLLPVIGAACMLTALAAGATLALDELLRLHTLQEVGGWFYIGLPCNWLIWTVLLFAYTRNMPRLHLLQQLSRLVFAGSLAELLATIPAHILVTRRGGCFAGIGTGLGVMAGLCVMLWAFGPAILLLELHQREKTLQVLAGATIARRPARLRFTLRELLLATTSIGVAIGLVRLCWGHWLLAIMLGNVVVAILTLLVARRPLAKRIAAVVAAGGILYLIVAEPSWTVRASLAGVGLMLASMLYLDAQRYATCGATSVAALPKNELQEPASDSASGRGAK